MNGFTLKKEYYLIINKLKKAKDREALSLAIMEYAFEDKMPENLSKTAQIAFEMLVFGISKSKSNSGRGGRPKAKNTNDLEETKRQINNERLDEKNKHEFENRLKTDLKPIENRFFEEKSSLIEKESTKEKDITHKRELLLERKKESDIYKITNNACAREGCEIRTHEDIMLELGLSDFVRSHLKDFLRHCYLNHHIVSNAKLEDIAFRLVDELDDDKSRVACINRAVSGGWFDVKT